MHTYAVFVTASLILCLVPGPDMVLLLGRTVAQGRKAGICTAIGINLGAYVHLICAATGLSALVMASATAFTVVKWIGAGYLFYMGYCAFRSNGKVGPADVKPKVRTLWRAFIQGFLSDVLNPKVGLFFLAFLPQFIDPRDASAALHIIELGIAGNMVGITTSVIYVFLAAKLTTALRQNPTISVWLTKALGGLFIGLGVKVAAEKL
ncbi:LysE family translocator [Robbsia sp. KACC 23696]|uniref:LysE family translocator n=1 Tax=Robbsia sp. KACC 23696 TaxID=3149231 RepID=UPI00325BB0B3